MTKLLAFTVLLASVAGTASAGIAVAGPEIDASSGLAALGLLGGAMIILRSRRK